MLSGVWSKLPVFVYGLCEKRRSISPPYMLWSKRHTKLPSSYKKELRWHTRPHIISNKLHFDFKMARISLAVLIIAVATAQVALAKSYYPPSKLASILHILLRRRSCFKISPVYNCSTKQLSQKITAIYFVTLNDGALSKMQRFTALS